MGYWIDVYLCGLVVVAELMAVIVGALLIQLIFYRVFKINLYKKIVNLFIRLEKEYME